MSAAAPLPTARPGLPPAYRRADVLTPVDLWLAGNEGRAPGPVALDVSPAELSRYPSTCALAEDVAGTFGVAPSRVLVTAGADDGLLRLCLAYLGPGRRMMLPVPTFEMIGRYAALAGGDVTEVRWTPGRPYPTAAVLDAVDGSTSLIAAVSPNNPTGGVLTARDLVALCEGAPRALVVLDAAYAEFADEDLTAAALEQPNCLVLRTLSKAYGCAGLRVGFALGAREVIDALTRSGNPYPCSAVSIAVARERLAAGCEPAARAVRAERAALVDLLSSLGARPYPGQGNFVLARFPRARVTWELLLGAGIAVRRFPDDPALGDCLRITCPGDPAAFQRLERALRAALAPDALLFDMDGVLADVSGSYRETIRRTVAALGGGEVGGAEIDARKARGDANDDWRMTHEILTDRGVDVPLDVVTERFEAIYQGASGAPGLKDTERLLIPADLLRQLGERYSLAVVTGRPRRDALAFLERFGLEELFGAVVCREDAPLKPSPVPTLRAMSALGATDPWMIGDTPDDVRSARAAGALPVGVLAPGLDSGRATESERALRTSGAGLVLRAADELLEVLP